MKTLSLFIFFIFLTDSAIAQSCLTDSLIINTGYNPITGTAITAGANGAPAVIDPHWTVTAISPDVAPAIAITLIPGLVEVTPGSNADIVASPGSWASSPPGQPSGWISCLNSNYYTDNGADTATWNMTLSRQFRMCSDDSIKFNFYIADDNYASSSSIDATPLSFSQPAGALVSTYSTYAYFTQTIYLTAGTHTINIEVNNYAATSAGENPTGLDVYGTVSSATGSNSLVSESSTACNAYICGSSDSCNTVNLPDTLHVCAGSTDMLHATISGSDSILSIHWSPATGLSDTSALDPTLTVSTAGWYHITVESLIPGNLVFNGDFSAGDTGFSTSYTLEYPSITSIPGDYAVATDPYPYDTHWPWLSMGDHTTGTGNMLIVDGAPTTSESFWCQTIAVLPHTNYVFSLWTALLVSPVPEIKVTINGDSVSTFTTPVDSGLWQQYYVTWNSGTDTTAIICMYDLNTAADGNDFVVDDISLTPLCVATDSIYVSVCESACDFIAMPDTMHACAGNKDTLHAMIFGPDSILSIHWSPATGLSDTSALDPTLTVSTAGWYDITVKSLIPGNLVVNGDFSAGDTGFSSVYPYVSGSGSLEPAGVYAITTNPHLDHPDAASFGDHTTGTGNMMAINGASAPIDIWCETISVTPHTNYDFSAWFANWSSDTSDNFPIIKFEINGVLFGSNFNFPHPDGLWTQFNTTWNSGTDTNISICIYDSSTAADGNDFAIDDISFEPLCVATDSIYVSVCSSVCDSIVMPDTMHACAGSRDTLHAMIFGPDSIISIHWSPATGLSDTGILDPVLTVGASRWYDLTVKSSITENLVFNGDFSAGDTGFSTAYTLEYPSITSIPGDYAVATDPYPYDYHWPWLSMGDHTTGTGNMLIVDGAPTTSESFWCQTISVAPYTQYVFSVWTALLVSPVPEIKVTINGDSVSTFTTPVDSGLWQQYYVTWNSGTDTTAVICMYDLNTAADGNDFVVDDISLAPMCVAADSIYVLATIPDTTHTHKDTTACASASGITLTAPAGYTSYLWSNGDTGAHINVAATGAYLTTATGKCVLLLDTFHVTYNTLTDINLGNDTSICRGDSLLLRAATESLNATYLWNTGSNDSSIYVYDSGTYTVLVFDSGCTAKGAIQVRELTTPALNLAPDTFLCEGQELILIANPDPSYTYTWSETTTGSNGFMITQTGSYWIKASNICGTASDTINVTFDNCNIWFPSAFTPNNDGHDDIARVRGTLRDFTDFSLSIYNRYGQRVFYTNDIYTGWDGTFNGIKQDLGTFFYMIYYTLEGKQHMMKGDLTLIR